MAENKITLGELLKCVSFSDVHLVHEDEDIELATIVEFNDSTLTQSGREHWKDVLNAEITQIFEGTYGLHVECRGVEPDRLSEFSYTLAGNCDADLYKEWITGENEGQEQSMN